VNRVFLLSPASSAGPRADLLLNPRAGFDLARRLQAEGAPLGEVFSFLSGLYFRGKLAYARAFADPPGAAPGVLVITPSDGLVSPDEPVTVETLRRYASVPIDLGEHRYLAPLLGDALRLAEAAPTPCGIVLLGSVATGKYGAPLAAVFGARLLFPPSFAGRGDMSRGGLLLRAVDSGEELDYAPLEGRERHGERPPKLPPRRTRQGGGR
jgi:hypothetical protein